MKIEPNRPQAGGASTPKGKDGPKEAKAEKAFESLLEGSAPGGKGGPLAHGKGMKGPIPLQGEEMPETVAKNGDSGKTFKNVLEKQDRSDIGGGTPGSQGLPLTAYLEPASQPKNVEAIQHAGMNIQEIEKLVDHVLVGVNETGEPQFKLDMHLDNLGPLNIQITRTEQGLQIHFNAETDKAGLQLGQNLPMLQQALAQKGLQVSNIQLLVGNEPLAMNQLIDSPRAGSAERVHRKDRAQKTATDKPSKPSSPRGR